MFHRQRSRANVGEVLIADSLFAKLGFQLSALVERERRELSAIQRLTFEPSAALLADEFRALVIEAVELGKIDLVPRMIAAAIDLIRGEESIGEPLREVRKKQRRLGRFNKSVLSPEEFLRDDARILQVGIWSFRREMAAAPATIR